MHSLHLNIVVSNTKLFIDDLHNMLCIHIEHLTPYVALVTAKCFANCYSLQSKERFRCYEILSHQHLTLNLVAKAYGLQLQYRRVQEATA